MNEATIAERAKLYLRAEKSVRTFFRSRFERLCTTCGEAARRGPAYVCCCTGVPCTFHLDSSPVLKAILRRSAARVRLVTDARRNVNGSLWGPTGCRLDWGRPAPCNALVCTLQRDCLRAVMPLSQIVTLCRALRVFHQLADTRLGTLTTLCFRTMELERRVTTANNVLTRHRIAFEKAREDAVRAIHHIARFTPDTTDSTRQGSHLPG